MEKVLTRREKEYLLRRNEILNAAFNLFVKHGYSGTKMTDIAKHAEFSAATVYNYFDSKEDIYKTLIKERIVTLYQRIKEAVSLEGDFTGKLRKLVEIKCSFFNENKNFFHLIAKEQNTFPATIKADFGSEIYNIYMEYIDYVTSILKKEQEKGIIKGWDAKGMACGIIGFLHNTIFQWMMSKDTSNLEEKVNMIVDVIIHGIIKSKCENGYQANGK